MLQYFLKFSMVAITSHLLLVSCIHSPTITQKAYEPFLKSPPQTLDDESLQKIKQASPKDASFVDILQAFALMRTADLNNKTSNKEILSLLESAASSFENMQDPDNFSKAFSADESKSFAGLPHERMSTALMAAVFHMSNDRYDLALPYLKNAEFLDARFQKLPFGTDAPLIYALMQRCMLKQKYEQSAINRAKDGIYRSIRFLELQEGLVNLLFDLSLADVRVYSVKNYLAYMILEISLYHSLISAPNNASIAELIKDASKQSDLFLSTLKTNFADEYEQKITPLITGLGKIYGDTSKQALANLNNDVLNTVSLEVTLLADKMIKAYETIAAYKNTIDYAVQKTALLHKEIQEALLSNKLMITFAGIGPTLERAGEYKEISVIKPSKTANLSPRIREKNIKSQTGCGFHRLAKQDFSLVLCNDKTMSEQTTKTIASLELLSLSRKAQMIGGRKFDKILKGRAQFRAATDKTAEIAAWSAFFLFYIGANVMSDCSRRNQSEACYAAGLAIWGAAGITGIFSLSAWLIGKSVNPSADSRFNHLSYESGFLSVGAL